MKGFKSTTASLLLFLMFELLIKHFEIPVEHMLLAVLCMITVGVWESNAKPPQ